MPAQPWATPSQLTFLKDHLADFAKAQTNKTVSLFWPKIYTDFFALWPSPEAELDRKATTTSTSEPISLEKWISTRKSVFLVHFFINLFDSYVLLEHL